MDLESQLQCPRLHQLQIALLTMAVLWRWTGDAGSLLRPGCEAEALPCLLPSRTGTDSRNIMRMTKQGAKWIVINKCTSASRLFDSADLFDFVDVPRSYGTAAAAMASRTAR